MRKWMVLVIVLSLGVGVVWAASMELTSARLYKKQGEYLKALEKYGEAIQKHPEVLEAYYERGELCQDIATDPNKADVLKQAAGGKPDPQVELLDRMLADFAQATTARSPTDESTVKKLKKKVNGILGDLWSHFYAQAVHSDSLYSQAVEQKIETPDPKDQLKTAVSQVDLAIKMIPEKWNGYGLRAQLLGKLGDRAAATQDWEAALQRVEASDLSKKESDEYRRTVTIICGNLLENYYNLERFQDALRVAEDLLRRDSASADGIQFKAFSLARMASDTSLTEEQRVAKKNEAIRALEGARKARPDDPTILYYIGQFHLQLADTAAALAAFSDYLKLDEKDKDVLFVLGILYLEGGTFVNTQKARDVFGKLVEYYPNESTFWINYGVALIRLGDAAKGKEAVEKGKALKQ